MHRRARISATGGGLLVAVAITSVLAGLGAPQGADLQAAAETTSPSSSPSALLPTSTAAPAPIVRDDYTVTITASATTAAAPSTVAAVSPGPINAPVASGAELPTTVLPDCPAGEEAMPGGEGSYGCGPADLADPNGIGAPAPGGGFGVPPGTVLTVVIGDQTITTPGAILDGLDVRGRVIVKAPNVTIRNSVIRGTDAGGKYGLVDATAGAAGLKIYDTEIAATTPNWSVNGIMGSNFELRRVNIHNVVDQVSIMGSNVVVADSWLHDNLWYADDPNQTDGSHDDNIQTTAGDNILISGNLLEGASNTAIMITQSRGLMSNMTVVGNRLYGGDCTVNVSTKDRGPIAGLVFTDNVFGRDSTIRDCAVYSPNSPVAMTGNTYTDGAAAILRTR